jgi:hypothetical protein
VIPRQHKTEHFDAIFVFDGEKAPLMSVVSVSKEGSIGEYQEWKTMVKGGGFLMLVFAFIIGAGMLLDRFIGRPRLIRQFRQHATELQKKGELKSAEEQVISDAITIYTSFITRPGKIWSKIFGSP